MNENLPFNSSTINNLFVGWYVVNHYFTDESRLEVEQSDNEYNIYYLLGKEFNRSGSVAIMDLRKTDPLPEAR